ncbi:MAG TPA: ACP S-malonyltransferase [Pyrinomonadaceae bacterium]|nr:ACP S-malonyltransferase [Pyrinomonadaceae bacterium]
MTVAYIFPGQGSQFAGMGRELAEGFASAREVFAEADDALGFALSELCFEGPADQLQLTENTQPAILTVSVAALRAMESEGLPSPAFVAGHSLGEYSALVAAGALSLKDAVRTVRARGRYMQEAVPVGVGAMAAILGADLQTIEDACREAAEDGEVCSPANINSPKQIVIAGNAAAVERAMELLKARGAKRALKLPVSAPFHCALMQPAQERLSADLDKTEFADLRVPLVTNVDAVAIRSGNEARASLVRQVSSPVRWLESVEALAQAGVETFVEVGPGKVLSGLVRQIIPDARCLNVGDAQSLEAARDALSATDAASGGN